MDGERKEENGHAHRQANRSRVFGDHWLQSCDRGELLAADRDRETQDRRAYVSLEPANHNHIMDSVYIFEGCYIGVQLPISAQAQVQNHQPWSVPPGGPNGDGKPGSWGGHAVPVVAYDARGLTVVTWGALQTMTWSFWEAYCDEAYAILSPDYLDGKQQAPQGFSMQELEADLADLK